MLSNTKEDKPTGSLQKNYEDPLFGMGADIFTNCFSKEDDGLQHFLSLRIRHGSFAGYLRAPLEKVSLLEQGSFTNTSQAAEFWKSMLTNSNPDDVEKMIEGIASFQTAFDSLIESFKSDYLRIQTKDKPKGLFVAGAHIVEWDLAYSKWEDAESFDIFFDRIWSFFNLRLENSLEAVRDHINNEILEKSDSLINQLRKNLEECNLNGADKAHVTSSINDGSIAFQEAVKVVERWFHIHEATKKTSPLELTQVIELAKKVFENARPSMNLEIELDSQNKKMQVMRTFVPRFIDVFFIAFDNIYLRSKLRGDVNVKICVVWKKLSSSLGEVEIKVKNLLGHGYDVEASEKRLISIREIIEEGNIDKYLTTEGGTGLVKLSKIAQDTKGTYDNKLVNFEIQNNQSFNLTVKLIVDFESAN